MYYRLQLKDASGKTAVSKVVVLKSEKHTQTKLQQVYPNPFKDSFNISVDVQQAGELSIQLVNMQGQVVHQQIEWITSGSHELELKPKHLNKGIYILKLNGAGLNQATKVVKASN
ncbi:hypothetical protein ABID22_002411 [Pontibacter aydingkolensis]|uniref:T9SS type A sorting domain-containing protein n=1 Tax=Pontibacter aydingkolensis TaxID=1911536 RepID=A0ABS7CWX3_9BACT|nr:T9SS type A sorting domain-containing protein [Pontibacter aydingkolensis]MBW7468012.1 T9SS type A sorting domain-containing protein [Pontibacter aydingkolensis]